MAHLEQIREACIKANPEIVEMRKGSIVQYEGKEWTVVETGFMTELHQGRVSGCILYRPQGSHGDMGKCTKVFENWDIKIIGRPIRLADVLVAIGSSDTHMDIVVSPTGRIGDDNGSLGIHFTDFSWNLLKDDLTQQSEETIDFIHSVLTA